jgi:hypothetical protein
MTTQENEADYFFGGPEKGDSVGELSEIEI